MTTYSELTQRITQSEGANLHGETVVRLEVTIEDEANHWGKDLPKYGKFIIEVSANEVRIRPENTDASDAVLLWKNYGEYQMSARNGSSNMNMTLESPCPTPTT